MRILHLSPYYPPETQGGTQGYVRELAALQRADGHEVTVIAGTRGHAERATVETSSQDGIRVRRITRNLDTDRYSGDLGSEEIGALVESLAREIDPQVAHVHHWHALSRDNVRRLKTLDIPVALTLHDLFTTCPRFFRMPDSRRFCAEHVALRDCAKCVSPDLAIPPDRMHGLLVDRARALRAEMSAADAVLCVSDEQLAFLRSLPDFPTLEVRVLGIGIETDIEPPPGPTPRQGHLRVVNWAGLDPRKGIPVLLEAVARARYREQIEVHLHGQALDPDYVDELRSLGRGLAVSFSGVFGRNDLPRFAGRHDVAVFPSLAFETYGLVVDEALWSGIPVLVTDRGAPPGRIGSRGLTFPIGDAASLAHILDQLAEAPDRLLALRRGTHRARGLRHHHDALTELYRSSVLRL